MTQGNTAQAWARGGVVFAGVMMLVLGVYEVLVGIAAVVKDQFFVVAQGYAYSIDTTAWGWIHIGIGAVAFIAGLFIFTGAIWARAIGIAMAVISATANFFFLPYYPIWSIVIIAIDIFVIWALATARVPQPMTMAEERTAAEYQASRARGGSHRGTTQTREEAGRWPANPPSATGQRTEPAKGGTPSGTTSAPSGSAPSDTAADTAADTAEHITGQARPPS